jgi:hypothetical protein
MLYYRMLGYIALAFAYNSCSQTLRPVVHTRPKQGEIFTYSSGQGDIIIDLPNKTLIVLGHKYPLKDCSDIEYNCSQGEDFILMSPKVCDDKSIPTFIRSNKIRYLGFIHDAGNMIIGSTASTKTAYVFSQTEGILALYYDYDNSGVLANTKANMGFDRTRSETYLFKRQGSAKFMQCRLN